METPILLLDVDGVLCPWGDSPEGYERVYHGDDWDWISGRNIEYLAKLMEQYKIVWTTARCDEVHDTISHFHNLPILEVIDLNTVRLGPGRRNILLPPSEYTGGTWKMPWVMAYVEDKCKGLPVAWLDDDLREDAHEWAQQRNHEWPTKLVQPLSLDGMLEEHFNELVEFAS